MEIKKTPLLLLLLCFCFCFCLSGCSDPIANKIKDATKQNVRKVAIMYTVYTSANNFQGPKDEAEFKAWMLADEKTKERMAKFGINVDDFDEYMISDRTGDKLEIRWGIKSAPMAPPYPVAFEPNAVDGVRHVGMCGGETREVTDDDEYDELWAGKVSAPAEGEDAARGR